MFTNTKTHQVTDVLRIKDHETLDDAMKRLRTVGWSIPDIGSLEEGSDSAGKYFRIKGTGPKKPEPPKVPPVPTTPPTA